MKKLAPAVLALGVALVMVMSATPVQAAPDEVLAERDFARKVLQRRANLSPPRKAFIGDDFIRLLARDHSAEMARRDELSHRGFTDRAQEVQADNSRIGRVCEVVARAIGHSSISMPRLVNRIFRLGGDDKRCLQGAVTRRDWVGIGVQRSEETDFYYVTFISGLRRG